MSAAETVKSDSTSYQCGYPGWDGAGFPQRLAEIKGGMSTLGFAQKCGISESIFRKYLAGTSVPGADKLVEIAQTAQVSLSWLATGEGRRDGVEDRLDLAMLRSVIAGVEADLEEIGGSMAPEKKAELIALLYEMACNGESISEKPMLRLVRLASR
ncbi:MAG: helix-turn-helix domain-containing protein [Lamprobacter sp.]|uniref:helix-turn-helix domain-containing protein n=1 Tax=Lamprobacter sp. TaxID=3100796 RepID=UPI002B261E22|nr:helix-turn-helix domain-containing protein [Lamprobacter sp.]MEA3643658.1 helix-turn-helix domain-containing protein [Lamprobacter sp.]